MRTGTTRPELKNLILDFRKQDGSNLWKRVAKDLDKPSRQRRKVNLYTINKTIRKEEIALVPGKVLSLGNLDKKITIAALDFSDQALLKIKASGSKAIFLRELFKTNPEGKMVRIIG